MWTVQQRDNAEVLASLEPGSVDAIVTDPPYEIGMMGREWDKRGVALQVERWAAMLHVLKPGGHLIAFAGDRTYHRIASAIDDAGFEIRHMLAWIYSTGFPKAPRCITSHMDKAKGDRDDVLTITAWIAAARDAAGFTNAEIDAHFGLTGMAGHWTTQESQPQAPTAEHWPRLLALLGAEPPPDVASVADRVIRSRGVPGDTWMRREIVGEFERPAMWRAQFDDDEAAVRAMRGSEPVREGAAAWKGWSTALRPSIEPAVLARAPFQGPAYANLLRHGVGALNVEACRLPMNAEDTATIAGMGGFGRATRQGAPDVSLSGSVDGSLNKKTEDAQAHPAGRWPPNVMLDAGAAAMLDAATGERRGGGAIRNPSAAPGYMGGGRGTPIHKAMGDTGGASRFFYCDKASTTEREAGLESDAANGRWNDGRKQDDKDYPSHRGAVDRVNVHPTVKPIDVMRWLVRMVTPPGGLVLDPYCGSGTTGIAAVLEGFDFLGVELDPLYADLSRRRIAAAEAGAFRTRDGKTVTITPEARKQGKLDL